MADNPVAALARGTSALEISEHSHWPLEFSPPQGMERGPSSARVPCLGTTFFFVLITTLS